MEKKKNKKSIVIGMTSLVLVTLILLGLTYAYYKTRIVGNTSDKSVSVVIGKLEVAYTDGNATFSTGSADKKIEPGFTFTKEFTVTNTGSGSVNYSVILDNIENTFTRDQDWEYTLTKGETEVATGTIAVGTHQVLIGSETLESGSQTYKLTVTYIDSTEDQSIDMDKSLSFRVNISEETQTWESATNGTLLYAIKNNEVLTPNGIVGSESTTPGQEESTSSEARILSTQDDYGTSYIYRGNVGNNYVTYSNMCWRIVRVQGDGTIKLILADSEHSCGTSNGYSVDNADNSLIDVDGFGIDILGIMDGWMSEIDTSKLVETEWCEDFSSYKVVDVDLDHHVTYYYFGAYERLVDASVKKPNLKCNSKGSTTQTVGTLTADEAIIADTGTYSYLQTNVTSDYISLTPAYTDGYSDGFGGYARFALPSLKINWDIFGGNLRPSIVLKSNVTISSGNGTVDNPYIVK